MRKSVLIILLLVWLNGCGYLDAPNEPVSIAREFWNRALSLQPNEAKGLMLKAQQSELEIGILESQADDSVALYKMHQMDAAYFVETALILHREGRTAVLPMKTVMVYEEGHWRVDYWSTKQSVIDAILDNSVAMLANTLKDTKYLSDVMIGSENEQEALASAGERIDQTFALAKQEMLKAIKEQAVSHP